MWSFVTVLVWAGRLQHGLGSVIPVCQPGEQSCVQRIRQVRESNEKLEEAKAERAAEENLRKSLQEICVNQQGKMQEAMAIVATLNAELENKASYIRELENAMEDLGTRVEYRDNRIVEELRNAMEDMDNRMTELANTIEFNRRELEDRDSRIGELENVLEVCVGFHEGFRKKAEKESQELLERIEDYKHRAETARELEIASLAAADARIALLEAELREASQRHTLEEATRKVLPLRTEAEPQADKQDSRKKRRVPVDQLIRVCWVFLGAALASGIGVAVWRGCIASASDRPKRPT